MALNIHSDSQFEKRLEWLSRRLQKTKTDIIKDLVNEKYHLKKIAFQFGALKKPGAASSKKLQKELKELDKDRDLA